jgi:hypothetical protein
MAVGKHKMIVAHDCMMPVLAAAAAAATAEADHMGWKHHATWQ